jgi:hypothetical protein
VPPFYVSAAMPYLPMPKTDEEAYARNTKEQYEALGRFVEAFEMMVHEVREICIERICSGIGAKERKRLVEISFHHQAMSAKPLFDIMRAILAEIVNDATSPHYADRASFKSLLGRIESEYSHLQTKRNELLHGTWFVGYVGTDDPNASEFFVRKFKTSADGLIGITGLPKSAAELFDLAQACENVRHWLGYVDSCLQDNLKIADIFEKRDGEWTLIAYNDAMTLPKR